MSTRMSSGRAPARLGMAVAAACALGGPAYANAINLDPGTSYIDPTDLHVGATSDGGPGTSPNLISGTEFFVANVGGQDVDSPIDLFFAVAQGAAAPTISSVKLGTTPVLTFGAVTNTGDTVSAGQDVYTQLGCIKCDNSVSYTNMTGALTALGLPVPTTFTIYEDVVSSGLPSKDYLDVTGTFGLGTFVVPFGQNVDGTRVTLFDTSFTNTGLADAVPEPSTWAMLALGFMGLGYAAYRRPGKQSISALA